MMKFEILNTKALGEEDFKRAFEKLSRPQKNRCLRFKFEADRRRLAFGEELLRELIKKELGCTDEDITISRESSGRPVATVKGEELFVSISHSGDFVACALSLKPVGIDLEVKREVKPQFLQRVLNQQELEFLKAESDEALGFLKIWTAKEAFVKLTGKGLGGLSEADVLPLMEKGSFEGLKIITSHSSDYACSVIFEE